jgi:2-oxoglutarate dehydrogenase E1 component
MATMGNVPRQRDLAGWWSSSHLAAANAGWLERLYEDWLRDPASVEPQWREWFASFPRPDLAPEAAHAAIHAELAHTQPGTVAQVALDEHLRLVRQSHVHQLIEAYRALGHLVADLDPLGLREIPAVPELQPAFYGLTAADLNTVFEDLPPALQGRPLSAVIAGLRHTYCGTFAAEYVHVADGAELRWLRGCLENRLPERPEPSVRRQLLQRITAAEVLERYLHHRYVGQKRFSLEGAESLIPLLDELIQRGGAQGVKEIAIGMAHRGRLNVLVNIMGKSPADLFREFEGNVAGAGTGDVKYHQGFSSNFDSPGGPLHVALAFNPSHLEIVCPVVQGSVRARQERRGDRDGGQVVPILIHGDAAFSGQGVVMETFNMSQSRGYSSKGTVHVVVNNQIGFTTSNQKDARSTRYCTDVAKMVNAPIFHVNGDDPEAVLRAARLAIDYRMRFRKDVVIDLICYRRHGHSEADEPAVTQPMMYRTIRAKPSTCDIYAARLREDGVIDEAGMTAMIEEYRSALEAGRKVVPYLLENGELVVQGAVDWSSHTGGDLRQEPDTRISLDVLRDLAARLGRLPAGFELHPNVARIYDNRRKMAAGALPIDWGFAELLAYASLVTSGYGVRLSGQDSARGTFFHRHAAVHCQRDDSVYVPLRHLDPGQSNFLVTNSLLSEEAVLAFEYGYATTDPNTLVIWEAQFGDFANNAQVVIDQFISAGEQKWNRLCGLVMFLPHGYEGQGPEHSSARPERYLQLCAQHNMQVCVPTMPAQMFHLLRRQMLMRGRKPLVVMTPKSLLRLKLSVSALEDFTEGAFLRVIDEADAIDPAGVRRMILCSGKVYFDLLERRRNDRRDDVAIIRLEQLYPFPEEELRRVLARYPHAEEMVWCQEEPRNQGAWHPARHRLIAAAPKGRVAYAGRPASASPAVGYPLLHIQQLHTLLDDAFGPYDQLLRDGG